MSGIAEHDDRADEAGWRLKRRATIASVGVAAFLAAAKLAAWMATGSVAILSGMVDSAIDVLASVFNLLAVWQAAVPADHDHSFGHGKAEALAGFGQGVLILGSAGFLVMAAARRLVAPEPLAHGAIGAAVMIGSIVLSALLVAYQRHVARRTGSLAIAADSLHFKTDLLSNLAVLVGVVLAGWFGFVLADPIMALAVAGYVGLGAWAVLRRSYDQLMDRELPDADRQRIRAIVLSHPEIHEMHELRTRMSGTQAFIQFHIAMNAGMALVRAHEIASQVEQGIRAAFPGAEVLIHEDPVGETSGGGTRQAS